MAGLLDFVSTHLGLAGMGLIGLYLAGALTALDAVMKSRTPQGATAWVFALATLPFAALPLYWIFGRTTFEDYTSALRQLDTDVADGLENATEGPLMPFLVTHDADIDGREAGEMRAFDAMATLPFTSGNGLELLVDGQATFEALFEAIDGAKRYVLAQFYIIHDDDIGQQFKQHLIAAVERGVTVRLLFDSVGSWRLPRTYKRELAKAGIHVCAFTGPRNWLKKLRLNFRNHRKIVVCDGRVGFVGGLNVGDEYLGRDPAFGPWRDTHLRVEGPTVQGLQLSFARDWFYAARVPLDGLTWEPTPASSSHKADGVNQTALVLASGPSDKLETCGLLYTHAIESAEERVWIASPYFVPDGRVLGALQLAALRGVDVRVLMPRSIDSILFKWVPYAYLPEVERAGVKVYLYEPGFMHQKVALVDRDFATVGTANFDNRSFRLNFEATVVARDDTFCDEVEAMLEADFARATQISQDELADRSVWFRFAAQATRLLAPVL